MVNRLLCTCIQIMSIILGSHLIPEINVFVFMAGIRNNVNIKEWGVIILHAITSIWNRDMDD